jgi:hypothetical protein
MIGMEGLFKVAGVLMFVRDRYHWHEGRARAGWAASRLAQQSPALLLIGCC